MDINYKALIGCLSCFGLGVGTGFLISKKKHDAQLECEKESYRKALSNYITKRETKLIHEEEKQSYTNILEDYAPTEEEIKSDEDADLPELLQYVSINSVDAGEEYPLSEITYYQADKIFADEADEALSEEDMVEYVGGDQLDYFLYGSSDEIYVRNNVLERDFAIVKDMGSYREDVLENKPYLVSNIFDTAEEG